ncbi:hypothetical protein [Evansella tamaricis]|uniref:Uncharacterized protein n=1 Tax=Evansella tamaricis TaxID=2069301 RepID=A0ABS6JHQ2_9BACI|nr:hypothetical protein [Evansella tamaricis]MBU9712010.1 hypothetical protein [Evansella tamaricis]
MLALLFSNMGFALIFYYLVVSFLKGYTYRPKIIKNKYLDNVLGATLSQAVYVPFTAVFITAFKLGWKVKILFTFYFAFVERVFIKYGLFQKKWWKTGFTVILIPVYFFISDIRWKWLEKGIPFMKTFCLFNMIHLTWINGLYLLEVLRELRFGFGKNNKWNEQIKIVPFYVIVLSAVATWVAKKGGWSIKGLFLSLIIILDQLLIKLGILKVRNVIPITLVHSITVLLWSLYKNLLSQKNFVASE